MQTNPKESHTRSLIKGVTWRILATTDTIFVVLLVTCINGTCSLKNALAIGFWEFFIKYIIYYAHERAWQYRPMRDDSPRKTLWKSISWRFTATSLTFFISGAVLESFDEIALYIALTELFTKFALYYIHERIWLKVPLNTVRNIFKVNNR